MSTLFIEVHALQTVPPSNLNRDDTGSPKTAVFGGVRRARVSSQAWKRAMRDDFATRFDAQELGIRSTRLVERLADFIATEFPEIAEEATALAGNTFKDAGLKLTKPKAAKDGTESAAEVTGYLVFASNRQLSSLAHAVGQDYVTNGKLTIPKKELVSMLKDKNSVDLALFGRMIADNAELNVDAAAQVAHALGVSKVQSEFDYFTAVDDVHRDSADATDAGAAMIGTVEFNSSTLYRYANINYSELKENLGTEEAAKAAAVKFVESFVHSMPTGKQNTFANRTLPDGIVVTVRTDQPISLVNAFIEPIEALHSKSQAEAAAEALANYATALYEAYGNAPELTLVQGIGSVGEQLSVLGTLKPMPELLTELLAALAQGEE